MSRKKITIVLVDDEPEALQNLQLLLKEQEDCKVVAACQNGHLAIEAIRNYSPDLVFLDIQMPEISGFDVIKAVRHSHTPYYVFTTAYDQYAVDAFEVNAIDYLLKPFDDQRFASSLNKVRDRIHHEKTPELSGKIDLLLQKINREVSDQYINRIPIKTQQTVSFLEVKEVSCFLGENQYVNVVLKDGTQQLIRESLNKLESNLDPKDFFRTHRSSIVRLDQIEKIEPHFYGNHLITIKNGMEIKLSKTRREALKRLMGY